MLLLLCPAAPEDGKPGAEPELSDLMLLPVGTAVVERKL